MQCPQCGYDDDTVKATRKKRGAQVIRRRRQCGQCGYVHHTIEQSEAVLKATAKAVQDAVGEMAGRNGDGK